MKKYLYILLAVVASMSSCTVEDGQSYSYKTYAGYQAFSLVQSGSSNTLFLIEMMNRVDLYVQSPENEKVKEAYLPTYTISKGEGRWIVEDKNNYWEFIYNNKSINEIGAEWSVVLLKKVPDGSVSMIKDGDFILKTVGDRVWDITTTELLTGITYLINMDLYSDKDWYYWPNIESYNNISSHCRIKGDQVKDDAKYVYGLYTVLEGEGKISNGIAIDYAYAASSTYSGVSSSYQYFADDFNIKDGGVDLSVKIKDGVEDKVSVEVKGSTITVTMGSVTEVYN